MSSDVIPAFPEQDEDHAAQERVEPGEQEEKAFTWSIEVLREWEETIRDSNHNDRQKYPNTKTEDTSKKMMTKDDVHDIPDTDPDKTVGRTKEQLDNEEVKAEECWKVFIVYWLFEYLGYILFYNAGKSVHHCPTFATATKILYSWFCKTEHLISRYWEVDSLENMSCLVVNKDIPLQIGIWDKRTRNSVSCF